MTDEEVAKTKAEDPEVEPDDADELGPDDVAGADAA